jgi:SMI1 / KNR4 family (SUKH-1)
MKQLLKSISKEAIALNPNFFGKEKNKQWIGREPAKKEAIAEVEKKLGIKLPKDVIEFYKITNGTSVILNQTYGAFIPLEQIDWLKNADPFLIECYTEMGEAYVNDLINSIIISGINYAHSVLIIQPYNEYNEWRYWEFASYFPGERPFKNMQEYLLQVNNFLIEQNKK